MTETPVSTGSESVSTPATAPVEAGPSGAQSESAGSASTQPEAATESPKSTDWQKAQHEDPTLKAYIDDAIARARASDRNKARRDKARAAVSSTDQAEAARAALDVARDLAAEEVPEETNTAKWREKKDKVLPFLDRMTDTDEYADLWKKHGKAEMDKRFFDDPEKFADWVFNEVTEARVNKRADKRAMDLAKAMSAEQTSDALRNLPTPIGGSMGGNATGGMTLDRLMSMSAGERIKWKRENASQYDALVASLA